MGCPEPDSLRAMQTVHDLRAYADEKLFAGEYPHALHAYALLVQLQPNALDARLRLADTLLSMGEVQAAGLIYMKLAQHAANAGYPLRALVCLLILRQLEPELGKHVEELAKLYGKGSERLGKSVRMSLASTNIQLPGDLKLDTPPPLEELLPAAAKIAADLSKIAAYPQRVPPVALFSELPPETFAKVLGAVKLLRKRPGEAVLTQGDAGTAFYVVARGRVRVERTPDEGGDPVVLAKLHGGAIFGEMALVSAEPRSATVIAEDDCDLLEFDKAALAAAASEVATVATALDKFTRERLLTNLLATAPLFKPLDRTQRLDLARRFKALDVTPGTPIIRDGDPGKGLYVVLSGGVEVWKTDEGEKVMLANLGPGQVFGEIALLHEEAATANVSATKQSTVLFLARELFQKLVDAIEEIREYVENLGDERLMDTRLSMENTDAEVLSDDDLLFI